MEQRVHKGYTITNAIQIGEAEIVLGVREGQPPAYATWMCQDGSYFWGHYTADLLEAQRDWLNRAQKELDIQMQRAKPMEQRRVGREVER